MEIKDKITSKISLKKVIPWVILFLLLIPSLYSVIMLGASWNPYNNVNNVPVAFVNLDTPVTKNDKTYNIGKELENKLKDNDSVNWEFVSADTATKGIESGKYYAEIVVPKGFSETIANTTDGKFDTAKIIYKANVGKNYIFSQISSKVAQSIKSEISTNIQNETSKVLVDNLINVKDSLNDAATGTNTLYAGINKLNDGSQKLTNGIGATVDGSSQLKTGLGKLASAQQQVVTGETSLINGLNQLKGELTKEDKSVNQLVTGAANLSSGLNLIADGANKANGNLSSSLNKAADGIQTTSKYINNANDILSDPELLANIKSGTLSQADIQKIMTAKTIIAGVNDNDINGKIAEPLRQSSNAMDPLVDKLNQASTASKSLAAGTEKLVSGISKSKSAAGQGVDQLIAGANALQSGNSQILTGLNTASTKTGDLSNGLSKVKDGSEAITSGLVSAKDGSKSLKTGLNSGYNKLNDNLKFTSNEMSSFIGNPVTLDDQSINTVNKYGEGLAPYFMSLSLWIGAMFISIALTIINKIASDKHKFLNSFTGKYIIGSAFVAIQALILTVALKSILDIDYVNGMYFTLGNILISVVYFTVMYGISNALGIIGVPITFVLFILQLSAAAGTFPIETAPTFYRVINKFIPMSYSVDWLRMTISGVTSSNLHSDLNVLLIFLFVFLSVGFVIWFVKNKINFKKEAN